MIRKVSRWKRRTVVIWRQPRGHKHNQHDHNHRPEAARSEQGHTILSERFRVFASARPRTAMTEVWSARRSCSGLRLWACSCRSKSGRRKTKNIRQLSGKLSRCVVAVRGPLSHALCDNCLQDPGKSSLIDRRVAGSTSSCCAVISFCWARLLAAAELNGTCPDSIWYMTTPNEYASVCVSAGSPIHCRGHVERCSPLCARLERRHHVWRRELSRSRPA